MKLGKLLSRKIKASIVGVLMAIATAGGGLYRANDLNSARNLEPKVVVEHILQEEVSNENLEEIRFLISFLNSRSEKEIEEVENILKRHILALINIYRQDSVRANGHLHNLQEVSKNLIIKASDSDFQDVNPQDINFLITELRNLNIQDKELEISPTSHFIVFITLVIIVMTTLAIITLPPMIYSEKKNLKKGENKFPSLS